MKRLIVFDLDGTLAQSKSTLDSEMAELLGRLMQIVKVAIISGGAWAQFEGQALVNLPRDDRLNNLSLLPTCGTEFYCYHDGWRRLYSEDLSKTDKAEIIKALNGALKETGFHEQNHWGDLIEDRGTQITFSALGQAAPLEEKMKWDPDFAKRKAIKAVLDRTLPKFSVKLGGATSIDFNRPGIDKGYGVRKLREILHVPIADMLFVGDAVFPGGNDYPAKEAGVTSIRVRDPEETKRVIEAVIACLDCGNGE
jgi:HAD superfamily hydrolase (TIGR01484 family)